MRTITVLFLLISVSGFAQQTPAPAPSPSATAAPTPSLSPSPAPVTRSTDPYDFTVMEERVVHGSNKTIDVTKTSEVDDRSTIQIRFDQNKMMLPDAHGSNVTIRLAVLALRGTTVTEV